MSLFNKIKSILKNAPQEDFRKLPPIIQNNVNPRDYWEIIGELGDGAFGKVEKAVSKTNRSQYAAAKAIEVQEGETIEDFLVEIEILTGCKHINIVDLYAAYFFDNKLHMMLELCGGGAVDGIMIELEKPLNEPQIAYIAKYTNEALIFLHEKLVIHRDLKAGNILLTTNGIVKLADFGVSAKLKDRNTKRDTFIGTPYWMSPEVMMCETFKDQPYTTVSDIWSFGITLIEMAQMEPPHSNVSPMRVLIKVQKSEPPTLERPNAWSIHFNDFLTQCLVKDPSKRRSAVELQSHPFICDKLDKRPIMTLMAEVNAEIQEEIIIDDERSVDGSLPESEDIDDGSWAVRSTANSLPAASEAFKKPDPLPILVAETAESPKKRVAPPPPATLTKQLDVGTVQVNVLEKNLVVSPKAQKDAPSPRREALDVLENLNEVLDDEGKDDYFDNVPSSSNSVSTKEPWMVAPSSPSPTRTSPVPDNIKRVIQAAKTPSPLNTTPEEASRPIVSENITASFRNNEVCIRIDDTVPQNSFAKAQLVVTTTKNRKESVSSSSSQSRPPSRKELSPTVEKQDMGALTTVEGAEIPEGHVKNKIKQVIEEQAIVNEAFEAKKIAQDRREADAVLFRNQAPVARIAASFQAPTTQKDQNFNNTTSPTPKKKAMVPPSDQLRNKNESDTVTYFNDIPAGKEKAPPPEPPVDYEKKQEYKENDPPFVMEESEKTITLAQEEPVEAPVINRPPRKVPGEPRINSRKNPARQTITKKTRTYTIDGMQVTSTTMHVLGAKEDMQMRKQQLQDLRRLQREEARQKQELQAQGVARADAQERKFQQEKINLARQCEIDMEVLERKQKREIEDAERSQEEELRQAQKRIKIEQEKDLKAFRDRKKQEMKIAKQEMDLLPRSQRKEALKLKKEHMEHENHMMEADFQMQLQKNAEATLARLAQKHKERIAQLERQFLTQKHILLRTKENNEWELEEKQMGEKYVLHRQLFKDEYFLLRTQMLARHQKELTQALKIHQDEDDELIRALALDRKQLPKRLRQDAKTRVNMFKESLLVPQYNTISQTERNNKVRRFEEQENLRAHQAMEEHDHKSARKVAMLKERHAMAMRELEEMQNEKKKQLLEKERVTMQEHEKKYFEMREQWQADLVPRKMMLESKFQEELESQERFYGVALHTPLASTSVVPPRFN